MIGTIYIRWSSEHRITPVGVVRTVARWVEAVFRENRDRFGTAAMTQLIDYAETLATGLRNAGQSQTK